MEIERKKRQDNVLILIEEQLKLVDDRRKYLHELRRLEITRQALVSINERLRHAG